MSEKVTLPPYMRKLLLTEICESMDIITYCLRELGLVFCPGMRNFYSGYCPYCLECDAYHINQKTGRCFCVSCGDESDFITLVCDRKGYDVSESLCFLSSHLEEAERQQVTYCGGVL